MSGEDDRQGSGLVPYFRYAVHNPYNYALLTGVGAASLLTGNGFLALAGAGLEALWMAWAPGSKILRRLWFDRAHAAALAEAAAKERARKLAGLPDEDKVRVVELERLRDQIRLLAHDNRALTTELLRDELTKVEALGASFTELLLSARRYRNYLASVDLGGLEAELREQERRLSASKEGGGGRPGQKAGEKPSGADELDGLARKNLAILQKRREKLTEMKEYVSRAEAQMQLVENTFRLLADQILTMRSPAELSGQLDDLIDGVEAVRSTAREAEGLMEATS
jgi:hypothetical protein